MVILALVAGALAQGSPTPTPEGGPESPRGTLAPIPPPPPTGGAGTGFLLKLHDPDSLLQGAPQVRLTDAQGTTTTVTPRDDGTMPDTQAGDSIWSGPVFGLAPGPLSVQVEQGERTWQDSTTLDGRSAAPLVQLQLRADGTVPEATAPTPPGGKQEERPLVITDPTGTPLLTTDAAAWQGTWLWILALSAAGLGAGLGSRWLGRRPEGPARLAPVPTGSFPPMRLHAEDLDGVLAGPLAGHRVVTLGDPLGRGIPCLEEGPLPWELVRAVEALAATPGPPVALLVADPAALDAPGRGEPLEDLARRVGGRFPLWCVGGPPAWGSAQGPGGTPPPGAAPPGLTGA